MKLVSINLYVKQMLVGIFVYNQGPCLWSRKAPSENLTFSESDSHQGFKCQS